MTPFIYGAALAYVLNPVLNWLEKKVFPKVFGDRVSKRSRRGLGVLLTFSVWLCGGRLVFWQC